MKRLFSTVLGCLALCGATAAEYPRKPAEMTAVKVTSGFWFDRLETNRTATLKSNWDKCFETPRIANFTNAARRTCGTFKGIPFDDSDVYKMMEGTAYILATHPDKELEERMTWLIGEIAKAQEPDGYLYTARTLLTRDEGSIGWMMGPIRWCNVPLSHELYNVGHLYEAAVAWYRVTGRDDFLTVARKSAYLVGNTFGPGEFQLKDDTGHEEIELALCKLYQVTGEAKHLALAKWFVDVKGREAVANRSKSQVFNTDGKLEDTITELVNSYRQDHLPLVDQREAVGHAVRATYLYCGAADVAALTGEAAYATALKAIWEDVVGKKMHLTGGIGASPKGEAFGEPYELPNDQDETYLETCAAIGNALWNQRMFLMTGEAKYVDVLERVIYNGFLSGISLSGDRYFYPNPLATKGGYERVAWFHCSCCPVNDIRFVPQIPSFAYATDGKGTLYWNLFMEGSVGIHTGRHYVEMEQKTDYPWSGKSTLKLTKLSSKSRFDFALKVRIPGWAQGRPVPSDLYVQTVPSSVMEVLVSVNGQAVNGVPGKDGYLTIEREWKTGDTVEVQLPMAVKRVRAHEKVAADRGRLAVERGPIVYCAEGCDNGGKAYDAVLPADASFTDDTITVGDKAYPALKASTGLKLIPYCLWGNREPGNDMQVWFRDTAALLLVEGRK